MGAVQAGVGQYGGGGSKGCGGSKGVGAVRVWGLDYRRVQLTQPAPTASPFTSAILYLNDDFQGGKFFFAHGPKDLSPQVGLHRAVGGVLVVTVPIPIYCLAICEPKVWTNGRLLSWSGEHAWCYRGNQGAEMCGGTVVHTGPKPQRAVN